MNGNSHPVTGSRHLCDEPGRGVLTLRSESYLLRMLWALLPTLVHKVKDPSAWVGMRVCAGRGAYERFNCREEVVAPGNPPRRFLPALHAFEQADYVGELHNHRYRLAVLPLGTDASDDLYDMDWEVRETSGDVVRGSMLVHSGCPYAIERCAEVFHAIRTRRRHYSVNLSEITEPPVRDNRLDIQRLTAEEALDTLLRIQAAVSGWVRPA